MLLSIRDLLGERLTMMRICDQQSCLNSLWWAAANLHRCSSWVSMFAARDHTCLISGCRCDSLNHRAAASPRGATLTLKTQTRGGGGVSIRGGSGVWGGETDSWSEKSLCWNKTGEIWCVKPTLIFIKISAFISWWRQFKLCILNGLLSAQNADMWELSGSRWKVNEIQSVKTSESCGGLIRRRSARRVWLSGYITYLSADVTDISLVKLQHRAGGLRYVSYSVTWTLLSVIIIAVAVIYTNASVSSHITNSMGVTDLKTHWLEVGFFSCYCWSFFQPVSAGTRSSTPRPLIG